jgi:hypothetical protein
MKLNKKSEWDQDQIIDFLEKSEIPIRLSFLNSANEPQICSLWYFYDNGAIWCASHKNSFLINQLKCNSNISFEISSNEYPYKGVRGKAAVELSMNDAESILSTLISKYLGCNNAKLSSWLISRADDEYVINITPTLVNSWDFSNRMEK